ncbi:Rne/Rng family ribonuclease [Bacillus taeanensis]|uniref:Ribonuclease E/G n=1 Tax=Bacillus taeanensis TaxID=273032 RepID=A0A366Y5W4_9BACI|nr:Rne/Rng family ribonuclease [Bacillus taeanensis]RBW71601.1 ribonuclease E/G [Bacillus taeanensis]
MKKILMNLTTRQQRVAIVENGKTIEFFVQESESEETVGNIYKGKVTKVLPGMQAVFVDIGMDKNGYLSRDELAQERLQGKSQISQAVKEGEEILVQVTKEAVGTKGPRLTEKVSIPGIYMVFMPKDQYIGVSKNMPQGIRASWREFGKNLCENKEGVIIRTAAQNHSFEEASQEFFYLKKVWKNILANAKHVSRPSLVYRDLTLTSKVIRDFAFHKIEEIIVDDYEEWRKLSERLSPYPQLKDKLILYKEKEQLFLYYGIESELLKALKRIVWLKDGIYLVIDQTEALTSIDVNTGKFTGKINLRETVLKANKEAAKEIARQLRLRDIGGIILIDFISMKTKEDEQLVIDELTNALKYDRVTAKIFGFTKLGLLEMTRKKERKTLLESHSVRCEVCDGTGYHLSLETVLFRIERDLLEYRHTIEEAIWLEVSSEIYHELKKSVDHYEAYLEDKIGRKLIVTESVSSTREEYKIRHIGSAADIHKRINS